MTNIYIESFVSVVFLWVFLTLSIMTAILILRIIDKLAGAIYNKWTQPSKTDLAIDRINRILALYEAERLRNG